MSDAMLRNIICNFDRIYKQDRVIPFENLEFSRSNEFQSLLFAVNYAVNYARRNCFGLLKNPSIVGRNRDVFGLATKL